VPRISRREFLATATATGAVGVAAAGPIATPREEARARISNLRVDYLRCPLGLENTQPQLSWTIESTARGLRQIAYRIVVASSESLAHEGRGDLWDSGKVRSGNSLGIVYAGVGLCSRQRCWWRVQVWDQSERPPALSSASWWEMGLLSPEDWTAQWLAAEDAVGKMDRETPMSWVWGKMPDDTSLRKFRSYFDLPQRIEGGTLFLSDGVVPMSM
jgi:alpha-L-rhamnosidase